MAKFLTGDDKILSKIKAALDKANSTDSLAEKEACMLLVQKLMQKNHVEQSRVTSYEQIKEEGVEEDEIFYEEDYEAWLLHYIAQDNFCQVILKGSAKIPDYGDGFEDTKCETMIKPGDFKKKMSIVGEPTNVNMCLYLYSFFRHAILELSVKSYTNFLKEMMVEELKIKMPKGHKDKFLKEYVFGCVKGIHDKMEKAKEEAARESNEFRGVMVIKEDKVKKYMAEHYPRLGRSHISSGNSNSGAYNQGRADGAGINARGGISGGKKYIG